MTWRHGEGAGRRARALRPERVLILGFAALILLGGGLLALPAADQAGGGIGVFNALFTATSAVCVTGLVAVDTGRALSGFGQVVLLCLMEIGAMGFMTFAAMVFLALGRRLSLKDRMVMRESMNRESMADLKTLSGRYALLALGIQLAGFAMLSIRWIPRFGLERGAWYALFHAVSAFCNAGFDLFGGFQSFTGFSSDPWVLLTLSGLIVLGGIGFGVLFELGNRRKGRALSLHARVVLTGTVALLAGGTALVLALEWDNPQTLGDCGIGGRLLNAFFQSATMRTAGFNSLDLAAMGDATKLVCCVLMFIGAAPASTGGGVKITTAVVVLSSVLATIRGDEDATFAGRSLPKDAIRRALTILSIAFGTLLAATILIAAFEKGRFSLADVLMETTSAIATVGVSSIGSPNLCLASRALLIPLMFLGRLGPLTIALGLSRRGQTGRGHVRYPEESIMIG